MSSVQRRWLALWAALLSAVVCLWFIPASRLVSVLILLVLLGLIAAACYGINRRPEHDTTLRLDNLPEATYRQPVVLVCGDLPQSWPEQSQVLTVTQGCWIRVEEGQDLAQVARQLLWQRPDWGRQLSVMVSVCPQQHADSEALTSRLNPTISGPVPVEPTESALTELKLLSPLWRQHYGFALAARAKPDDSARLKAQWQDYIVGNALAPQSLTGWHQGMEGLQTLMQRLNALDERKGKYLTGSELKSMVFTIMQDFGRTVPVEEQLYLLSQEKNGAPLPAALLLQTDTHFNQLLNRYALIQQPSETP